MDDPIKIIWRYKNSQRRLQYHIYIYIGNVPKDVLKILNNIASLNFYDTLISLTKAEFMRLEEYYGKMWYLKLFNTYHINYIINLVKESSTQKKELTDKFGQVWITDHIEKHTIMKHKLFYNYETTINNIRARKSMKKGKMPIIIEDETDLDYTTHLKDDINKIFDINSKIKRQDNNIYQETRQGEELQADELVDLNKNKLSDLSIPNNEIIDEIEPTKESKDNVKEEEDFINTNVPIYDKIEYYTKDTDHQRPLEEIEYNIYQNEQQIGGQNGQNGQNEQNEEDVEDEEYEEEGVEEDKELIFDEGEGIDMSTLTNEEIDMEEIEELYKDVDVEPDKDIDETTNLIQKILHDDNLFEKRVMSMIEFDTSKDNNMYDENLKDVYMKFYVTEQYIYKDDTIKAIRDKICCSIKNNIKFNNDSYVIPSRQYLWAEYYFNDKISKIMIGQKWIRSNELLNIDVEPNANIRYYEELRGNLRILRDNIRRYANKIRREDDDTNILFDYEDYVMNNELYLIDIYNEFGLNYKLSDEELKNIADVYIRLYFPKIRYNDIKYIIDYLNNDKKVENDTMLTVFDTINNDLIMSNEVMNVVETAKISNNYKNIFYDNYITQSTIHVNLRVLVGKIDLYRIFNEFIPTDQYPFLQYQTIDGTIFFKFKEEVIIDYLKQKENSDILTKWFENSPYGISFKIRINTNDKYKFVAINLNETGRIEYKIQWKEEDRATIEDTIRTYMHVKDLIRKINSEKNMVTISIPDNNEFKYAFINTIQRFELPDNYTVNHNDLSEFSRYFYPYVALVIDPRKRQAKKQKSSEKSKFGTYLRYKRISGYENQQKLEQRIMYFMRNYEVTDQTLANEIAKQFNITEARVMDEIEKVKQRYPTIKKARKLLKKMETIPKYKSPGIGIDIQGRQRENYKIKISGARDKEQLSRIISFMNILIHLYVETYLYKLPERQVLKEKLKKLTNIARRRAKVAEIVNYDKEIKTVKQMTHLDKKRIGFKPEKGQNQWTRSCQNSGNDKKRRPQQYNSQNMEELIKKGYALNRKTGAFEKRVMIKDKDGKKQEIVLKTIKLKEFDEYGNLTGNDIHYSCSPEDNGDHMYIGFLTRSSNPHGYCMPCCFKKNSMISKNKEKREFYERCLTQEEIPVGEKGNLIPKAIGDKLYILQDTNKIQEGRFGFLQKYLDFYFNTLLNKQKKISQHYLIKTETGYFFKYGSKQDEYQFLNAIASLLDITINDIKNKVIEVLEQDKNDLLFISINNGDIRTQFGTRDKYIDFIKYNKFLDFDIMHSIISVIYGLNIIMFQKDVTIIKRSLEKEKIKEDFYLICQDNEDKYSITDPNKKTVFMLKEENNYYPIVMVIKDNINTKDITVIKTFTWEEGNIVDHVKDFYERNCYGNFLNDIISNDRHITAREIYHILLELKEKIYQPKYQIIDSRNKCRYMITYGNIILAVQPSGSIYNLQIIKSIDKYIDNFESTYHKLLELYDKSNKNIPVKPIGIYFNEKNKNKYQVIAILTNSNGNIPVIHEFIDKTILEKYELIIENKPLYDTIDKEIEKGKNNFVIDKRIEEVNYDKFYDESYELFRLEFSSYINREENIELRSKLESILTDTTTEKDNKIHKIKLFIYKLIDKDLYDKYKELVNKDNLQYKLQSLEQIQQNNQNKENLKLQRAQQLIQNYENTPSKTEPLIKPEIVISKNIPINQSGLEKPINNNKNSSHLDMGLAPQVHTGIYDTTLNDLPLSTTNKSTIPDITSSTISDQNEIIDAQIGGKPEKFVHVMSKLPNLLDYQVNNDRNICPSYQNKEQCQTNIHCHWSQKSNCYISLTNGMIITFVNRISEELVAGDLKALEILNIGNYSVSNIANYDRFTERPGQRIIRSNSNTIKKVLHDLFGKDNIPVIGKRRGTRIDVNYQQMNMDNPLRIMRDYYVQHVIDNNLSIFRAYVNAYYWQQNTYYDIDNRNLGYNNILQTELSNYFRSLVIDWLKDVKNKELIENELLQYMNPTKSSKNPIQDFIIRLGTNVLTLTNGIVELYVLNKLQKFPIIVYNDDHNIIYIFDDGLKYNYTKDKSFKLPKSNNTIQLIFNFITNNTIPDEIEVIYNK